jgi:23S rRNA (guanine745-N1)-methyltransferase
MHEDIPVLTDDLIAALRCPLCRRPLEQADQSLRCAAGHSFDLAKQGYAFLGTGRQLPQGDTAAMIEARQAFLARGHFAPIAGAISLHARGALIADLGAGTGYYLSTVLNGLPRAQGLAFDVSKPALKRAARAHPRMGGVLADTWGELPLADHCVDLLLNVFAPRNGAEMHRVLRPDGTLIVVTPEADHLLELREELGLLGVEESKADRLTATLARFDLVKEQILRWSLDLDQESAAQLVLMGPNGHHTPSLPTQGTTVTAAVRVTTWRGRPLPSPVAPHDAGR